MIEAKVLCNKKEEKIIVLTKNKFLVHLKSKPVDNKANKELIKLLSNFLDVNKNQIMIKSGLKARTKIIEIKKDAKQDN